MTVPGHDSADGVPRLAGHADAASGHARDRLRVAAFELMRPDAARLSDYQRASIDRLAEQIVRTIEDDMRIGLAAALGERAGDALAALETARVPLAFPILARGEGLRDPGLLAVLLRRADEHAMATRIRIDRAEADRLVATAPVPDRFEILVRHADPTIAAAAMALLIAEGRRHDGFDDAVVARPDLPAELHGQLVWGVAAGLRAYLVGRHGVDPDDVDRILTDLASAIADEHDPLAILDARAMLLVRALDVVGLLDDAMLSAFVTEAHLAAAAAALAQRAGLALDDAWDMLLDPGGARLALLLRAIDVGRDAAATMLATVVHDLETAAERIADFDAADADGARRALAHWQLDPRYRRAIEMVGR